jgi:N-methylhydantoinase B
MTHLNDIHMLKPVVVDGKPVFYLWAFLHLSDVGGRVPGSISASNRSIDDEGIRVPPSRLYSQGSLDESVADAFLADSRTPDLNWGDMKALVAALNKGEERSLELVHRFGANAISHGISTVLMYGERKSRSVLASLPTGTYAFTDYIEMHGQDSSPVPITVSLSLDGTGVHVDFAGTGAQVPLAYNVVTFGKRHSDVIYGLVNFLRTVDPTMPSNAGILRPISVEIPAGSVLNPAPGAAIGARMGTVVRTMEATYGALAHVTDVVPAASGDRTLVFISAPTVDGGTRVSLLQPVVGGSGARSTSDGIDGIDAAVAWLRNVPTEALEMDAPVLVGRYRLATGFSAGRQRGGRGTEFEFTVVEPGCRVIARNRSRRRFRPWGRAGGEPGGFSYVVLNPGTPREQTHDLLDVIDLTQGETLRFVSGYGGAFGCALGRNPARVQDDVAGGAVDILDAEIHFGVSATHWSQSDRSAQPTDAVARGECHDHPRFTRGIELLSYELRLDEELMKPLVAFLARRPAPTRVAAESMLRSSAAGLESQRNRAKVTRVVVARVIRQVELLEEKGGPPDSILGSPNAGVSPSKRAPGGLT